MRAAICDRFGPPEVVRIEELDDPEPGDREVLIRVRATTVTTADWRIRARAMPAPIFRLIAPLALGFGRPRWRVLGTDLAGVVERVGARVTRFGPGDRVVAVKGVAMGAHAELVCVREDAAVTGVPASLSFSEAAAIPFGAMVALRYLRDLASVRSGQRVLICGAAGAIGSASVQLARHMGADVTGVCSTGHLELVKGLGATTVIDRTTTDFTQGGLTYDVVLDTVGATSLARCRRALTPRGQFLAVLMRPTEFWQMATTSVTRGRRVRGTMVMENLADLEYLMGLAEAGHLRPVIDSTFPLEQIVEAHRRVDSGRKAGSVVVTMTSPTTA